MDNNTRATLIKILASGKEVPEEYKELIFPTINKEYEISYNGKMREEDVLSGKDGVFSVPLQIEKSYITNKEENWNNIICFGDNLQFLKTINENTDPIIKDKVKGKVKLIYIDPPFATEDEFKSKEGAKAYKDKVRGSNFIELLRRILIVAREIMSEKGSIFVHIDQKMGHYVRVILDEIFDKNNFVNEIIWKKTNSPKAQANEFGNQHDIIYIYAKDKPQFSLVEKRFNVLNEKTIKAYNKNDNDGKGPYQTINLVAAGNQRSEKRKAFEFMGITEQWLYSLENLNQFYEEGRIYKTKNGKIRCKKWLYEIESANTSDMWIDQLVAPIQGKEQIYPTQKPESLLERIIKSATNEDEIVMDFFGRFWNNCSCSGKIKQKVDIV